MINKIWGKITFKAFRNYVLDNQARQWAEIKKIQDQIFLSNPIMVLGNLKIYLPLFYVDHIQKTIYQTGNFYEITTLQFLKHTYKRFNNCIDIGTNIGNHALFYCAYLSTTKVYAFEPNLANRNNLLKNIELNHLENKIEVYDKAIGDAAGKGVQKDFSLANTGMNRIEKTVDATENTIDIVTLDSYAFQSIDFIKIDVEGFEVPVLLGSKATILKNKPVIMIEVFEKNIDIVNEIMKELNYKLKYTIEEHNLIFEPAN
jgi:FkbM family methyltransferase